MFHLDSDKLFFQFFLAACRRLPREREAALPAESWITEHQHHDDCMVLLTARSGCFYNKHTCQLKQTVLHVTSHEAAVFHLWGLPGLVPGLQPWSVGIEPGHSHSHFCSSALGHLIRNTCLLEWALTPPREGLKVECFLSQNERDGSNSPQDLRWEMGTNPGCLCSQLAGINILIATFPINHPLMR